MKKILNKFIVAGLLLSACLSTKAADLVFSTNITATAASTAFLLIPNRAVIKQIMLTGGAGASTLLFYDQNTLAAPYYGTNWYWSAYATNFTYATNYVTTFIGYNGVTNYTTNAGVWTISVTNAAGTNLLPVVTAAVVNANQTAVYTPTPPPVFAKGVVLTVFTNVGVTIFYTTP